MTILANMLKNRQNREKKKFIQRRGKTFIAVAIVSLILILGVFFLFTSNVSTYNVEERTMIIRESLFSNDIIAEISLKSDLNVYVIRGKDRLVAELEVDTLEKDYNTVFEKIDFYSVKDSMKKFNREFTYKYKQFYEEEVNDYETICEETIWNEINKTNDIDYSKCYENLIGSHFEERFNWLELNDKEQLPEGKLTIGIFTDVLPDEKVEWIPTILGTKINEWAIWTESLNVDLWAYYTFNETSGTDLDNAEGTSARDGTLVNANTWTDGKIGNSLYFDGTGDYVSFTQDPAFGNDDFAIGWWQWKNNTESYQGSIGYEGTGVIPLQIIAKDATNMGVWASSAEGTWDILNGDLLCPYSINTWEYFILSRNGNNWTMYKNGEGCVSIIEAGSISTTARSFVFADASDNEELTGKLDEIAIWKRAITDEEAVQLYNGGAGITWTDVFDISPPNVIINSPANTSYNSPINFTVTATDDLAGVDDCWVTINAGVSNFTLVNLAGDVYNYSAPSIYLDGVYLAEFYCNDTLGKINNTETVSFIVDTINPEINITYPINLSSFSFNTVDVNYTYNDTNVGSCWYSNGTYEFNTSLTSCGTNITDVIWIDGQHNVTIWINDTAGNENSSRVTFTVDAVGPIVKLITPINNLNSSAIINDFQFNMTFAVTDWINFTFYVWNSSYDEVRKRVIVNGTPDADCSASDESNDFIEIECVGQNITTNDNYEWNVYGCKENGMCNFAASNFSFLVDTNAPVGVLDSPANETSTSTASQNFTINITDEFGIKNATLYIYNDSGDLYNQTTEEFDVGILETTWGVVVSLLDGIYTWFYEVFDFAGNEDVTENRTITVDTINPNINLTYPINNSNYTSRDLEIRYIAEDVNLNNCWWSNDSMLINHSLASCGTNITTQFWNAGNHNVTVWVNDTAGNQNSSDVTFHIRNIFENSQTYSATAMEQSSQTFSINITYDSDTFSNVVLILHYNNTEYAGTEVGNYGDEVIYNATITTPSLDIKTNFTFYWEISLINSVTEVINSTFHNQTVDSMLLGDCNAQNKGLYNFTIVDEKTQVLLNPATQNTLATMHFQLYTSGRTSLVANYSQNFTKTNPFSICLNNTLGGGESYILDGVVRYGADNYSTEFYHFQSAIIDSTTLAQSITLFDLDNSTSTTFKITYKDANFIPLANALIQIQRKYINEGVFKTVEIPKTDSIGQTIAHLEEENVIYTFIVVKERTVVATFTDFLVKCEDPILGTCEININAFKSHLEPETFTNVDDFSFTLTFNKTTRTVRTIYSIPSGSSATIMLNTTLYDGLGTTQVCTDSLTSASGTLSCVVPTSFGNTTIINTIYKNGERVARGFSSTQQSPSDLYGTNLMFLGFFLIITMIGVGLGNSPMVSGIFLIIGAILSMAFNLVANTGFFGYGATFLWLGIAVIIVLMKGANRE